VLSTLLSLFVTTFGIGALTFGGGYAILPVLQYQYVSKLHLLTAQEFATGIVIGQMTPGPLTTMVAFVGYRIAHVPGGIVASVGILLPAFLAAVGVARVYHRFQDVSGVKAALRGISLAVVGLLVAAIIPLARDMVTTLFTLALAVIGFVSTGPWRKDPVWVLLASGIVGAFLLR